MVRKATLTLLTVLAAGCASPPEAPPSPPPAEIASPFVPIAAPPEPPEPEAPRELCPVLTGLVTRGDDGFTRLRAEPLDRERWLAREILPGTERCTIEGDAWPRARLTCVGATFAPESRGVAQAEFMSLADRIDRCLAKPSWFPRDWERGRLFRFAMGERMQAWTDQSTWPPTAVVLKVQQDLVSREYHVRVNLEAVR